MTKEQRVFAEALQKELGKVFEKHIESLKNMKVSVEGRVEDVRKDTIRQSCK